MRKIILLLGLGLFTALGAFAQKADSTALKNAPEIVFDKTVYNFPTVTKGGNGTCEFTFTNKGKTPLIISNVDKQCGCTTPEWSKEPVLPGKKGFVKATFNTQLVGTYTKQVYVHSNAKTQLVTLTFNITVVEPKPAETTK
ncbi:MAG: DUF1573 domain-containing protein [Bacteroidota bacterium]|nr:DUF1573 domain-containing protein [Bacteroidota bacterium]